MTPSASTSSRSASSTPRAISITLDTVPDSDGVSQSWTADATTPGTKPGWFAFALRNTTDKQVERWLVIDRYNPAASGVLLPDLDARRIHRIAYSRGYAPERIKSDRADVFRITLEPGRTVTFVAELASDRIAAVQLWNPIEYEQRGRDRYLFSGVMIGITGLLAMFLTAVFAANHKAIFPSAAVFAWCVLAYLVRRFRLLAQAVQHQARGERPVPRGHRGRDGGEPRRLPPRLPAPARLAPVHAHPGRHLDRGAVRAGGRRLPRPAPGGHLRAPVGRADRRGRREHHRCSWR